jgi:Kae1-associated kinase Bud32
MQKIAQGAEAILYRDDNTLIKNRVKKSYRIAEIDNKLRSRRTRSEANLIRKAKTIIAAPQILEEGKFEIKMEFIDGNKVKDILNENNCDEICEKIGKNIAALHSYDMIHGDITTSNMILKNNDIYFIDFGLGFISKRFEDKAIDLFLLHEALESTHFEILEKAWKIILKAYTQSYGDADKVIKTLGKIEKRRRYSKH